MDQDIDIGPTEGLPVIDGSALLSGDAAEPDDADEVEVEDDFEDDADEPDAPDDGDGGDGEEDDGEEPDALAQREAALAERERQIAEWQRQQQQAASEKYWSDKWAEGQSWFAAAEAAIYEQAGQAYDPNAFVKERMSALNRQRDGWIAQYYQAREGALWQYAAQQAVPLYAEKVRAHYGLTEADTKILLKYHPDDMPKVAEDIRALRRARKRAAAEAALPKTRPGSGRGGGKRVQKGSDEHLLSLFASAKR